MAQSLLKDLLKFNEVSVHTNPSKSEVIEVLKSLQALAESVENTNETLAVGIIWIGHSLGADSPK